MGSDRAIPVPVPNESQGLGERYWYSVICSTKLVGLGVLAFDMLVVILVYWVGVDEALVDLLLDLLVLLHAAVVELDFEQVVGDVVADGVDGGGVDDGDTVH